MKTTFQLSTVNLQINGNNQNGYCNITRTSMIFKYLNFRTLLGRLYDKYDRFNIKLIQVIDNTALILNYNPTQPKLYFTMEQFDDTTLFNSGDRNNYGDATFWSDSGGVSSSMAITSSNKVNGNYALTLDYTGGSIKIPPFSYPVAGGVTFCYWTYIKNPNRRPHFNNDLFGVATHSDGKLEYFIIDESSEVSLSGVWTNDVWNHVCITHAANNEVKIYINNVLVTTSTLPYSSAFGGDFYVGRSINFSAAHRGFFDDFRYYNTIISDVERGYIYTNLFPQDGNYDNADSLISINVGSLPFENRGNGKSPMSLCRMQQAETNILSSNGATIRKPNDIGEISIDLVEIQTNAISNNLQSNISFLFEVEGIE